MIHDLKDIPEPSELRRIAQSVAMLETILMPEWRWRYYSFRQWESDESVFSMRDGSGDEMFVVFVNGSVLVKGFAHESSYSPYRTHPPSVLPGMLDGVPDELQYLLMEPALSFSDTTFCLWWSNHGVKEWAYGRKIMLDGYHLDGSRELLSILDGKPETYRQWATAYYEEEISLDAVREIYSHKPLDRPTIMSLNSDVDIDVVVTEAREIGFPVSSS
ncbi:MAG: hypothetical protein K8I60_06635 [Anaerolineae bacterium]|nr:hypothetical protein [Anaerolineae bacterium]